MSRNWIGLRNALALIVIGAGAAWLAQCGPAAHEGDSGIDPAAQARLVESLASQVIVPTHRRFVDAAIDLEQASQIYAGSLSEADRTAARQAWRDAMDRWQRAELLQIGPSAPASSPGGRWLRDEIYSFPVTSRCRIDQETVEESYTSVDALAEENVNVRGLDAMEYLLFTASVGNECSAVSPINADGQWAALGPDEVVRRRAAYASALATLVRRAAVALVDAWDPGGGDFVGQLTRPGAGSVYETHAAALDAISGALFYLDLVTKDRKIAAPAGIAGCTAAACPELVESPLAGIATQNVVVNLRAFQEVFLGAEPGVDAYGFDDLLASIGRPDLAERMGRNTEAAIASAESLDGTLAEAITANRESVLALHAAIKSVTDDLKGPFVTALHLTIPAEGAGDTD